MSQVSSNVGSVFEVSRNASGGSPPVPGLNIPGAVRGPAQAIPTASELAGVQVEVTTQAIPHDPLSHKSFATLITLAIKKHEASRAAIAKGFRYGVEAGEALIAAKNKFNTVDYGGLSWTEWSKSNISIPVSTRGWYVTCATYRAEIEFLSDEDFDSITQSGARRILTQIREARQVTVNTPGNPEPGPEPVEVPESQPVNDPPRPEPVIVEPDEHPGPLVLNTVATPQALGAVIRSGRAMLDLTGVLNAVKGLDGSEVKTFATQLKEIHDVAEALSNLTARLVEAD